MWYFRNKHVIGHAHWKIDLTKSLKSFLFHDAAHLFEVGDADQLLSELVTPIEQYEKQLYDDS